MMFYLWLKIAQADLQVTTGLAIILLLLYKGKAMVTYFYQVLLNFLIKKP